MTAAYTIQHQDGDWHVMYYGKPVKLVLRSEEDAKTVVAQLNEAISGAYMRGYDSGQNDASRQRFFS